MGEPLYEYRVYEAVPGKLPAVNRRFETATLRLFAGHGFRVVGMWLPVTGSSDELHYLLEWEDMDARDRAWAAFRADPEWQRTVADSERDGPIVARVRTQLWRNAPYAPRPKGFV